MTQYVEMLKQPIDPIKTQAHVTLVRARINSVRLIPVSTPDVADAPGCEEV
jgi:hypothetical protein